MQDPIAFVFFVFFGATSTRDIHTHPCDPLAADGPICASSSRQGSRAHLPFLWIPSHRRAAARSSNVCFENACRRSHVDDTSRAVASYDGATYGRGHCTQWVILHICHSDSSNTCSGGGGGGSGSSSVLYGVLSSSLSCKPSWAGVSPLPCTCSDS